MDLRELFEEFEERVTVRESKLTGLLVVLIEYCSHYIAKANLERYVHAINKHMRVCEVAKVSRNIKYSHEQVETNVIAEMRAVLCTLTKAQTNAKMEAEATSNFAFMTVILPMLYEEESKPKKITNLCIGKAPWRDAPGIISVYEPTS